MESLDVVEMHVVHAAPADVVVGVVLQQRIPRGLEQRRVVGAQGRRDGLSTGDGVLVLNLS